MIAWQRQRISGTSEKRNPSPPREGLFCAYLCNATEKASVHLLVPPMGGRMKDRK